ncbi:endonuclease/exonuclease/phosphatase family protein [Leptospira koniambonensis]|uniref:endonuclease/exonuclease/phosphatase family protein n=1 Tax=Leptospira koniambonensis TaxID=2484950 RepID=UPI003EBED507
MKLAFWNTQRLGKSTSISTQRQLIINTKKNAEVAIFCELTTACEIMIPQNLTNRVPNPSQLCYGAFRWINDSIRMDISLKKLTPMSTKEYQSIEFDGGNNFKTLCDRALAKCGILDGVHIYSIHGPASDNAAKIVWFVVCYLQNIHDGKGEKWIFIGDLNAPPSKLTEALGPKPDPIGINKLIVDPFKATHAKGKTLDYALTNLDLKKVKIGVGKLSKDFSDHTLITLEWEKVSDTTSLAYLTIDPKTGNTIEVDEAGKPLHDVDDSKMSD